MKLVSIDSLNEHLFETIEMLKNNRSPEASDNEKIDIETANAIVDCAKWIVEGYKVKAQVLNIFNKQQTLNTTDLRAIASKSGFDLE